MLISRIKSYESEIKDVLLLVREWDICFGKERASSLKAC